MSDERPDRDLARDWRWVRRIEAEFDRDGVDDWGQAMVLAFARLDREQHRSVYESLARGSPGTGRGVDEESVGDDGEENEAGDGDGRGV